jgi:nitrogen fixation/metabolism regulation signal transduction histidine kinase
MSRADPQCNVRLTHENRDWVKRESEVNRRSLTAQFNWMVEELRRKQEQQHANRA